MLDLTMRAIQAAMDGLTARQRIIAQNVANAETPGYLAGQVSFESSLRSAIEKGDTSGATVTTSNSLAPTNQNGNNVNLDDENVSLIDTNLRYQLSVEAMNAKFRILHTAIRRDT